MDQLAAAGRQIFLGGDAGASAICADGYYLFHAWSPCHEVENVPGRTGCQERTCATLDEHVIHPGMIELKRRSKTVRICFSSPANLAREGRRLAKSYHMSFSAYVTMLLERDLAERKAKRLAT